MRWGLGPLVALALLSVGAAPAWAYAAPQLWIARAQTPEDRGSNPWVPLDGARLTTGGEFRLGVTIQANTDAGGRQYILFQNATVPAPAEGGGFDTGGGACSEVRGSPGDIADFGGDVYAGDGTYTVTVAVADFVQGSCPASGVSATQSFTVNASPTVQIVGDPMANDPAMSGRFRGVQATLAGDTELPSYQCARNPVAQPDGSLRGATVTNWGVGASSRFADTDAFTASGHWGCVARAESSFNNNAVTGWGTPVYADIRGVFKVVSAAASRRIRPPRGHLTIDTGDAGLNGAMITLALRTCPRYTYRHVRRAGPTLRARIDSHGQASFRFRLPDRASKLPVYYLARPRFSGTTFVPATTAPPIRIDDYVDSEIGRTLGVGPADPC
jgi:hypothetical protein